MSTDTNLHHALLYIDALRKIREALSLERAQQIARVIAADRYIDFLKQSVNKK